MSSHINADLFEDRSDLISICEEINEILEGDDAILILLGKALLAQCKEILEELIDEMEDDEDRF